MTTSVRSVLVGARLLERVTVSDVATEAVVEPETFLFTLVPPPTSGLATATYEWNGSTWTVSEAAMAVPDKAGSGPTSVFSLRITVPYDNIAQGNWVIGWKSTANVGGLGEGSGEGTFIARATGALPPAP